MNKIIKFLKQCAKSSTIWFNTIGVTILTVMMLEPTLISWLTEQNLSYVIVIVNMILRFKTNKAVMDK